MGFLLTISYRGIRICSDVLEIVKKMSLKQSNALSEIRYQSHTSCQNGINIQCIISVRFNTNYLLLPRNYIGT